MANIWDGATPIRARAPVADPGLAAHLAEYPDPDSDPFEGATPVPTTPDSFVQGLARGASRTGQILKERSVAQGRNAINVLRALGPEARPFPGDNVAMKALNASRIIPGFAAVEALLNIPGSAIKAASEPVGEYLGASPEKTAIGADIAELLSSLGAAFLKTGGGPAAKALQSVGFGRATPQAIEAARMAGVTKEAAKGGRVSGLELSPLETWLNEQDLIPRDARMRENALQSPAGVPVRKPLTTTQISALRVAMAKEAGAANAQRAAEDAARRLDIERGGLAPSGSKVWPQTPMPEEEIGRVLAEARDAAEGRLPVPPGRMQPGKAAAMPEPPPPALLDALAQGPDEGAAALARAVEPPPTPDVIAQRMGWIRDEVENARTNLPTGKIYGTTEGETGMIQKHAIGAGKSIREQLTPLFPELADLPDVGPKEIVTAIDKDKNNPLYIIIKNAAQRHMAQEAGGSSDFDEFSRLVDDLAGQSEGPRVTAPISTQPPLLTTQATMPPTPLQGKAPQVEHGQLLEGFKQAEPEPPRLPLGEGSNTVELGMGLQIPKGVKQAVRQFLTGRDEPGAKPHWLSSGLTQWNRVMPGSGIPEKMERTLAREARHSGVSDLGIQDSQLLKLTDDENVNLMRVLRGRERPMNERVAKAAPIHRDLLAAENADYLAGKQQVLVEHPWENKTTGASGTTKRWKPYQGVENYYPEAPDPKLMLKYDQPTLARMIQRDHPEVTADVAKEIAGVWRARAQGKGPGKVSAEAMKVLRTGRPMTSALHERTFSMPEEVLMRPRDILPIHYTQAARERAVLAEMGPGDKVMTDAIRHLEETQPPGWERAKFTWEKWRGQTTKNPVESSADKIVDALNNSQTMTLLTGRTAIKQLSQVGMTAAEESSKNFIKAVVPTFSKPGIRDAKAFGAVSDQIRADMVAASRFGEALHPAATPLDKIVHASERGAIMNVKYSGITAGDSIGRRWAYHGGILDYQEWQAAARNGSAKAAKRLQEAGLTPTSSLDEVKVAASRLAGKINLLSDPWHLPAILYQHPIARLAIHLNRFNVAMSSRLLKGYIQPLGRAVADKDGREIVRQVGRIIKFLGVMGITGEALGDTLRTIQGRPEDRPGGTPEQFARSLMDGSLPWKVAATRLGDNLLFAGTGGYLQNLKEALLDPAGAKTKWARMAGIVLGSAVSSGLEGLANFADVATADREKVNQRTGRTKGETADINATKFVGRRIPGLSNLAPYVFPDSEPSDRRRALRQYAIETRSKRHKQAQEWKQWFRERQGRNLPDDAISKMLREYGQ